MLLVVTILNMFGCKDENIVNAYLNITKLNRANEEVNLKSDNYLINVIVMDLKMKELAVNAVVNLTLPDGIVLTKTTDYSGYIAFTIKKPLNGVIVASAESQDKILKGNNSFKIAETFDYNIIIYIKE